MDKDQMNNIIFHLDSFKKKKKKTLSVSNYQCIYMTQLND